MSARVEIGLRCLALSMRARVGDLALKDGRAWATALEPVAAELELFEIAAALAKFCTAIGGPRPDLIAAADCLRDAVQAAALKQSPPQNFSEPSPGDWRDRADCGLT